MLCGPETPVTSKVSYLPSGAGENPTLGQLGLNTDTTLDARDPGALTGHTASAGRKDSQDGEQGEHRGAVGGVGPRGVGAPGQGRLFWGRLAVGESE